MPIGDPRHRFFYPTLIVSLLVLRLLLSYRVFSSNFGKKAPGQNLERIIDLTAELGEINDIENNRGSKIYPQNQFIFDCIMPSIPLKHKCLSIILILVMVSHM